MEHINRNFKGIWIPKEIWENKTLNIQEKVILVEIDSLESEEKGCYASNKYFSDFFDLSTGRVSQIINNLQKKGWLEIQYETKNKQIINREIRIKGVFNKLNRGIKYSKEGYLENAKDNNIYINNINNISNLENENQSNAGLIQDFELIWKEYPNKSGKSKAYSYYVGWLTGKKEFCKRKTKLTNKQMWLAVKKYADECIEKKRDMQYIQMGSTFFNSTIAEYAERIEE